MVCEDTTQESPAQDPSLSVCYSFDYLQPPTAPSWLTYHFPVDLWRRVPTSCDVGAHLLIAVMCFPFPYHSQRQHGVVTSTHCLAQVLERMKSVGLLHRMPILRLCVVLVNQCAWSLVCGVVTRTLSAGAGEGCCLVSGARCSPIDGDASVWTGMTNDCLIDDGLPTGAPQACADVILGCSIRSDITHTNEGGGFGDNGGGESMYGAVETSACGWNESTTPRFTILSRTPRSAVLPLSHRQVRVIMATVSLFRKKALPLVHRHYHLYRGLRGQVEGNIDHSDRPPRRQHFRRRGLAVPHLRHDARVAVFCQHPRPEQTGWTRSIAQTRLFSGLAW